MRFPGMDPYLEDPNLWPGFHPLLADEIVAHRLYLLNLAAGAARGDGGVAAGVTVSDRTTAFTRSVQSN